MGRGIADFEYAVMVDIPACSDEQEYECWTSDIYYTAEYALQKAEHVGEWDGNLYILAQNDKMRVALNHEDTYVQVVCLPRYYRRWIAENNPACKDYDHTGNNYQNEKGEWIIECEIPYNIHKQAKQYFHRLCKAVGVVNPASDTYKNISVRTSAWTSACIQIDEFK